MSSPTSARGGPPASVARAVAAFLVAGAVVLAVTGFGLAQLQRQQAVTEAVRDARSLTSIMAHAVVGPDLTDAALRPGPERRELDRVIRGRVLGETIVRVKIWDAEGRIVYSDDPGLIGQVFPLPEEERRALTTPDRRSPRSPTCWRRSTPRNGSSARCCRSTWGCRPSRALRCCSRRTRRTPRSGR